MAWDVFRIGFFSDDLHLLDVARRIPLGQLLTGQYGIWPWYRPLSRELFFWLVVHTGPLEAPFAHLASLACLWAASCAVWRLAERLVAAPAAAMAPVLFVTYQYTKFLTGWASGFQDMLAIALTLWAVVQQARGHRGAALVLAGLAPLAKETGFAAAPLVLAWSIFCDGERRVRPWMLGHVAVAASAAGVHLWARSTWSTAGTPTTIEPSATELARFIGGMLAAFLTTPKGAAGLSLALALVAAAFVPVLVRSSPRAGTALPAPGRGWLLAIACAAGLAPAVLGIVLSLGAPRPYHGFPAIPWISLAVACLARRTPEMWLKVSLPVLAAVNIWGLAFIPPVLRSSEAWSFGQWDWFEAVRLSAATRHLTKELQRALPSHPESLVVIYASLPDRSRFQTEDGPATREALRDPTVRAYTIGSVPFRVTPGRFAFLAFESQSFSFVPGPRDYQTAVNLAATALMRGRPFTALVFVLNADPVPGSKYKLGYLRAASLLLAEGPEAYLQELVAAGFVDSVGALPALVTRQIRATDAGLGSAYEGLMRRPLTAAAHHALAESLYSRRAVLESAVSIRVAIGLDPARLVDRLWLASILVDRGEKKAARDELEVVAHGGIPALAARARAELARLEP